MSLAYPLRHTISAQLDVMLQSQYRPALRATSRTLTTSQTSSEGLEVCSEVCSSVKRRGEEVVPSLNMYVFLLRVSGDSLWTEIIAAALYYLEREKGFVIEERGGVGIGRSWMVGHLHCCL